MDYSKTLNLPEMRFPIRPNLARTEPEILSIWKALEPYKKRQRLNKENPRFLVRNMPKPIYEHIRLDDMLDTVLEDAAVKYRLMSGFRVPHLPVWNSYSPAIEREALRFLKSKDAVRKSELKRHCRDLCLNYVNQQKEQYQRLGVFADWDKTVLSSDSNYKAGMIRAFANLYEAGYLYKGPKPVRWCIGCQTDLLGTEIEYKNYQLLSLYVKFPVIHGLEELGEDVYMLVWTNTAWTLHANTAIFVHPDYDYVALETAGKEILILAASVVKDVMGKARNDYEIIREMKGAELGEIVYAHPFLDKTSHVVLDESVSLVGGTGCIHATPYSQSIAVVSAVDRNGHLTEEAGQFCSFNVFESVSLISLELEKRGCLLSSELVEQTYPHCSYCGEPTIIRVADKWILDLNARDLRQRVSETMDELDWIPGWSRDKLSSDLAGRLDWSISRQRTWGIPAPIFYCNKCDFQVDAVESINSSLDIIGRRGAGRWLTTKPNNILPEDVMCTHCGGRDFRWETEMLDIEFISAISYSMMLSGDNAQFQPADTCLGNGGQGEKWLQLSLLASVAIENSAPFKFALLHGGIVDEAGKKIRKSGDSASSIENLLDTFGADVLRLWLTSMDFNKKLRFSHSRLQAVSKMYQRIRNTCRFLLANLSGYDPESDRVDYAYLQEIDRLVLHRLAKFMDRTTEAFENSQFHLVKRLLYSFCSKDVSAFYLNMIKRRLYIFPEWSSSRRAAQTVIYEVFMTLIKVMAPILPFTAEEMWQQMPIVTEECPSVFLSRFPEMDRAFLDDELESRWDKLLKIRSEIHKSLEAARKKEGISNSSQASVMLYASSSDVYALMDRYIDDLENIFMVSKVRLMPQDLPIPDGIRESDDVKGLTIEIRRIAGEKCERCWVYSDTVGTNEQYPTLCYRCIAILEGGI